MYLLFPSRKRVRAKEKEMKRKIEDKTGGVEKMSQI
jgi:hypothetical protein